MAGSAARFVSDVTVYTQEGSVIEDAIEVNHPLKIAGWNIY
ncbi:cytochrome c biogenesis protein ResB, partial [Bacteroides heparinolyticus]